DGGHASNFEMQIDAPASTFLEGYGGLRYTISSGTYTLTGAVIDATATDAKKLGGVDASGYAKTEELSGRKYIYVQGGLTDDQLIYALPTSKDGTEDDTLVSEMSLKTINGQSIIGEGDIPIDGGGSGHYYIAQTTLYELLFDEGLIALPQNDMQGILDALTSRKLVLFPDAFGIGTDTENNGYGVMLAGAAEDLLYFTVADTSGGVFAIEVVYPEGTIVSRKEIGLTIYNTKTINGELLVGTGDIKVAPVPYTIRSLAITELAVGESFENEIEYIKQAITSGTDIEIYTGNGYGKAKAIYQELDDYVYLSFCQMASVIYMEINMDTGEIEALQSTH
ncbi:MAG: hypothetical protein IJ990_02095, partial [Alistipes sp.]|nr:hypothetical protein [Alistipes sp.]